MTPTRNIIPGFSFFIFFVANAPLSCFAAWTAITEFDGQAVPHTGNTGFAVPTHTGASTTVIDYSNYDGTSDPQTTLSGFGGNFSMLITDPKDGHHVTDLNTGSNEGVNDYTGGYRYSFSWSSDVNLVLQPENRTDSAADLERLAVSVAGGVAPSFIVIQLLSIKDGSGVTTGVTSRYYDTEASSIRGAIGPGFNSYSIVSGGAADVYFSARELLVDTGQTAVMQLTNNQSDATSQHLFPGATIIGPNNNIGVYLSEGAGATTNNVGAKGPMSNHTPTAETAHYLSSATFIFNNFDTWGSSDLGQDNDFTFSFDGIGATDTGAIPEPKALGFLALFSTTLLLLRFRKDSKKHQQG